jgi:hypothetical protein
MAFFFMHALARKNAALHAEGMQLVGADRVGGVYYEGYT